MSNEPITISDVKETSYLYNKLINKTNDMIRCDSECQKRKKIDDLKKKWEKSVEVEKNAPTNVEVAEKNYYVYVNGEEEYIKRSLDQNRIKAEQIKSNSLRSHSELMNEINTYYDYYKSQYDTYKKLEKYLKIRENENNNLKLDIDNIISSIETNDRRSVYEINNINYVNTIFNVIIFFYIITSIIFLIVIINKYFNINDEMFLIRNILIFILLSTLLYFNYNNIYFSDIYKFITNIFNIIFYSISS